MKSTCRNCKLLDTAECQIYNAHIKRSATLIGVSDSGKCVAWETKSPNSVGELIGIVEGILEEASRRLVEEIKKYDTQ